MFESEDIAPQKCENSQTSVKFHDFEELLISLFNKSLSNFATYNNEFKGAFFSGVDGFSLTSQRQKLRKTARRSINCNEFHFESPVYAE